MKGTGQMTDRNVTPEEEEPFADDAACPEWDCIDSDEIEMMDEEVAMQYGLEDPHEHGAFSRWLCLHMRMEDDDE
jgi:hypothetical protein